MKARVKLFAVLATIASSAIVLYKIYYESSNEIVLNGNIEIQDVNLSFRVSGRIADIKFDEGHTVKKGDVLAVLDSDIFEAQLKLAESKVEECEINLKNNKKDFDRNKILFNKKSVSEKVFDDITMKYKVSAVERDEAVANRELARISVQDTTIKSPVDGIILTKNIEIGEMISSGTPAFSIMPKEKTRIKTFANEDILSKINYNDTVYVNIDSMPNKKFKGHIGFISSEAEFTPKNIETKELRTSLVYRIRVIVDENAPELKQGMPVTISYKWY